MVLNIVLSPFKARGRELGLSHLKLVTGMYSLRPVVVVHFNKEKCTDKTGRREYILVIVYINTFDRMDCQIYQFWGNHCKKLIS